MQTPPTTRGQPAQDALLYRTKAEVATDILRRAILSGELQPGEQLTVIALAERFDLTRMPLREALSRLASEGLVEMTAHQPARVVRLTRDRLEEEYFVRGVLEAAAAAEAIKGLDDAALAEIEDTLRRMDRARDAKRSAEYWALTRQYHERIYAGTPSRLLRDEVDRVRVRTLRYLPLFERDADLMEAAQREHWAIFEAIRARDPILVERLVREHISTVVHGVKFGSDEAQPAGVGSE